MKKLTDVMLVVLILGVLLMLLYFGNAKAQDLLDNKVPIMEGICKFDKAFKLDKDAKFTARCVLALEVGRDDVMWVVLFRGDAPAVIIEVALDGTQKVVWKRGDKDS